MGSQWLLSEIYDDQVWIVFAGMTTTWLFFKIKETGGHFLK